MRRLSRRRIAPLIRVRQEIAKRLDPLLSLHGDPASLDSLVTADFASALSRESSDDGLRGLVARASSERFPLTHLAGRAKAEVPAKDELAESIAEAARGAWTAFDLPVHVDARNHDWTRHPMTGATAGNEHWSRVSFMTGVGGGDVKLIWDLSRHHQLVRLAQGYFLDRDEAKAESILLLLDQWIDQNPAGHGINWTSSLEIAFRAIAWCWIWALTCESLAWTKRRTSRFLVSLWHQARHVERFDSIHHSPNTHLTGEGLGLLYVGAMFPEFARARTWVRRGAEILESELREQVLSDGMHFERATGYHRYTAEFYLHFLLLADAFGITVSAESRAMVRAQVTAAAVLRRPDGTWPVIGDEDSGDTLLLTPTPTQDQGPLLAIGAAMFRDPSLVALTTDAHRAAGWWLLRDDDWRFLHDVASNDRATPNVPRSGVLDSAGYYMGRDGTGPDDWWCLVDAGPHGGDRTGHAHTDLGHVELAHGATHIVVDPGCAGYTIDLAARDLARSEHVHACLVRVSEPLAVPSGPFSWARVAPTPTVHQGDDERLWWCELTYDRGEAAARLTHRRQVVLVRGRGVVVCDWIDGTPPLAVALHWPLGDDALTTHELSESSLVTPSYAISWSMQGDSLAVDASIEPLRRSQGYGRECDGQLLRTSYSGASPASFVTCFTDAGRSLRIEAHDGSAVRIAMSDEGADDASQLVIAPGAAPRFHGSRAPASSLGVIR